LSKLTNLSALDLSNNQLSGPIPSLNNLPLDSGWSNPEDMEEEILGLNLSNNSQLCRDPNANYGTRGEVYSFPICSTFPLSITKTGTGTGIVTTTSNATINCGTTCQGSYVPNSTVTLTATSSTDSTFASWSGSCTGTTANATVTMGTPKSCTATFNKIPQLTLTISKTGTGTGVVKTTDTKINCGTTCQSDFPINSTVTLTATPSTDSTFASWSGSCTGTTANATVTMGTAMSCDF